MLGYQSTEKQSIPWSKAQAEAYLAMAAVGAIAGVVVAFAQTPLHWPGHKILFWLTPVLASRLVFKARAGASVGSSATVATTLLLGGRLAGGFAMMPLVILGGIVLDLAVLQSQRVQSSPAKLLLLVSAATAVGLMCFIKRFFEPVGGFFSAGNLNDLAFAGLSWAFFGFLAGLLGLIAAGGIRFAWKRE
jgi:hypothetical protein